MGIVTVKPHAELVTFERDPDWSRKAIELVELCGRVSHKSENRITSGSAEPFVRKIAIKYGHESILEHATFTALFVGSRSMSHQLVRHRISAITQESQRYCDYSDSVGEHAGYLKVVIPGVLVPGLRFHLNADGRVFERPTSSLIPTLVHRRYIRSALRAYRDYQWLREQGEAAEDAREVLPNETATAVYVTLNLRTWRHVFRMRLDSHAQHQIKRCVRDVYNHFAEVCPLLVDGLKTHSGSDIL